MHDTLLTTINRAARNLPLYWHIEVHIERNAGWVELYDDIGGRHIEFASNHESLIEEIDDAVYCALNTHKAL